MAHLLGPKSADEFHTKAIELIGLIYEAALDPQRWNEFLLAYSEFYPGGLQWLWIEDRERADVRVLTGVHSDMSYIPSYEAHFCATNPWTDSMLGLPEGSTYRGDDLAAPEILHRSEFYNDWLKPQDLGDGFGATILKSGRHCVFFTTVHTERATTGHTDLEFLGLLVPHMQRAARLHGRLFSLEGRADQAEQLIGRLDIGLATLDADGRVLFVNREAERILSQGDGLRLWQGRITASAPAERARLSQIISEMVAVSQRDHVTSRGSLAIGRPSGKRPYGVIVAPLMAGSEWSPLFMVSPVARASVYISDPERRRRPATELLGDLFGLTAAEARLAADLAAGLSLTESCDGAGISRETGRSQLKAIYEKTDTHRQGELIRLLLTSPGGLSLANCDGD